MSQRALAARPEPSVATAGPRPARLPDRQSSLELSAGRLADGWLSQTGSDPGSGGSVPTSLVRPAAGRLGTPLDRAARAWFEPRVGLSLGDIRIHADADAGRAVARIGATAATQGGDIWLRPDWGGFASPRGRRVLAHEVAHAVQPAIVAGGLGRSVGDWLQGSPDIRSWTYTQLVSETDELQAWLDRQITSSIDETRIREAMTELRREITRRERETRAAGRARPRRQRSAEGLPARRPRVLAERSSFVYSDPAEMRAEYDLIMEWLARRDIPRAERRILEIERDNLAPQFSQDRARVAGEERVRRLQTALTPSDRETGRELEVAARAISGVARDEANPNLFYLYQGTERIPISADQVARLRTEIDRQLRRASRMIAGDVEYSWDRYQSQVQINEDSPVISTIAGWLGGVSDPRAELVRRRRRIERDLHAFDANVEAGQVVAAAAALASLERQGQTIHAVARAFYEGYIEGAERAVGALEITRDVSFAIAGSIAAVVAAPIVAGAAAGAGLTGATATAVTIGGTGLVVGTGSAVVRGGSAAGGVLVAGGSAREAGRALVGEGRRGFVEGFVAGAGGGAARVLGPALGVGGQVSGQILRRVAAEAIVNGTTTMVDALVHGASVEQAVTAGLRAAALSAPGAVIGSSGNRLVRELGGPLAAGGTAYVGALAAGQSREEALRAATIAVTTTIVTSRAQHGAEADARLEARGRAIGQRLRGDAPAAPATAAPPPAAVLAAETPPSQTAGPASPTQTAGATPPTTTAASQPSGPSAAHAPASAEATAASPASTAATPAASSATVSSPTAHPATTPAPAASAPAAATTAGATPASPASPAVGGVRESTAATPPGIRQHTDPFTGETHPVTASARAPSAIHGHIRGTGAEFEAYNTALRQRGEIGIQRPGRINEGGPDFITARVNPNGTVEIVVSDATINPNKVPRTNLGSWAPEVYAAVNRVNLGDPALEAQIRAAAASNNITLRTLQVRVRPTGPVTITGW
ncbi:MAG TPA: DUF4157 domain-containing protein [Candidatus Acidoferrales bacterium]|nr:DUF4157 domain-containing protein [Candidatus Acidoferrales bacterium]